jgi:hypothetical protein
MGPAPSVWVENPIAIYHLVVFIFQEREIIVAWRSSLKLADKIATLLLAVHAHRKDFGVFFAKDIFQLAELLRAIRSPMAAVKYQDDILLAAIVGKRDGFAVLTLQTEIRSGFANFDPLEIRCGQIAAVLWAELSIGRCGCEEKHEAQEQTASE